MNRKRGAIAVALLLLLFLALFLFTGPDAPFAPDPDRTGDDGTNESVPGVVPADARSMVDAEAEDLLAGPNPFAAGPVDPEAENGELLVEVKREDGKRILGASVVVSGVTKKTDEEGYALFADIEPAAKYEIRAYGTDFFDVPGNARIGVSPGCRSEVRIVLKRGGAIRGKLVTPDGQPLGVPAVVGLRRSRFRLRPGPMSRSALVTAKSEAGGRFEICGAPVGTTYLSANAEFHTTGFSRPIEVLPGETVEGVTVVLKPAGCITGRVVMRGTGKPVANATLRFYTTTAITRAAARADEGGSFRIEELAPGRYRLLAVAPRIGNGSRVGIEVVAGRETGDVVIEIGPTGRITGTVSNIETGRYIRLRRESEGLPEEEWAEGRAFLNQEGKFEVAVEPGVWVVDLVDMSGLTHARDRVTVAAGRDAVANLRGTGTSDGVSVSGRVTAPDGRPAGGTYVVLVKGNGPEFRGSATTAADGTFVFHGVRPGTYTVIASATRLRGRSAKFEIGEESDVDGVRVAMVAQVPVRFLVKHASGNPAPRISLLLRGEDGTWLTLLSGSDARCAMSLAPGTWTVHYDRESKEVIATIEIKPGGSGTYEIVID